LPFDTSDVGAWVRADRVMHDEVHDAAKPIASIQAAELFQPGD
jgi:hypothetical protein